MINKDAVKQQILNKSQYTIEWNSKQNRFEIWQLNKRKGFYQFYSTANTLEEVSNLTKIKENELVVKGYKTV